MSVIESPTNPLVQMEVDPTYQAERSALFPREWAKDDNVGGHYKASFRTGLTTVIAAGGGILSMRWDSKVLNFILQRLKVTATITTAFGAAQENSIDIVRLINYSVADTGGTTLNPLLKAPIKDTKSMAPSSIADLRAATTVALTNGTATVEASPIAEDAFPIGNTVGLAGTVELLDIRPGEQTGQIFRQNEGFRVRILQTQGAAGVVVFHFNMEWRESPVSLF